MGVINYSDQFKFSGKGYMDAKAAPVPNLESLTSISNFMLAKYYEPGMIVLVLDDGLDMGPAHYVLTTDYKWERLVDTSELSERVSETEKNIISIDERVKNIASKVDTNTNDIKSVSDRVAKIAGLDKLKAGENVMLSEDAEGYTTISVDLSDIPVVESEVKTDENSITKNDENELTVKVSKSVGNALSIVEDGLFATGVYVDGDDLNNEIE